MSSANSDNTWRHIPHGDPGSGPAVTTTHKTGSRSSAAIIFTTAKRSAQIVAPYEAFSTLHPVNTLPVRVRMAAPTRYLEYGA